MQYNFHIFCVKRRSVHHQVGLPGMGRPGTSFYEVRRAVNTVCRRCLHRVAISSKPDYNDYGYRRSPCGFLPRIGGKGDSNHAHMCCVSVNAGVTEVEEVDQRRKQVASFVYLGCIINITGDVTTDVNRRVGQA